MKVTSKEKGFKLREALEHDIPQLSVHHRKMFEEIWGKNDLSPRVAYLHSMYTEPELRGKNLAGRIVRTALAYCKANGVRRVILNASEAGKPLYEKMGFSSSPEMMRIFVE